MEELLQKIVNNTQPKSYFQVMVSGETTRIVTKFNTPIQLDNLKKYEMALVNLETYYSFPNLHSLNNVFKYSHDNGVTWTTILIPEGSYDVIDLNDTIKAKMKQNKHYDAANDLFYITISANPNTLRSVLTIQNNYRVDFTVENSIRSILGFTSKIYTTMYNESEEVVNILSINSIQVNSDIITGSYVNGSSKPIIYSFFPNVSPGYKIIENPKNLVYLPLTLATINRLETLLTDQDGNQLNLRGEQLNVRFHIREI
jgi:hypothetical protein